NNLLPRARTRLACAGSAGARWRYGSERCSGKLGERGRRRRIDARSQGGAGAAGETTSPETLITWSLFSLARRTGEGCSCWRFGLVRKQVLIRTMVINSPRGDPPAPHAQARSATAPS